MINFDNSFFFLKNKFDFNHNKNFKENLILANEKSEEISKEFYSGKNQILQSFTAKYQKKLKILSRI